MVFTDKAEGGTRGLGGGGGVRSRDRRNQLKSLSKNGWNQSERARAGEGRVVKQVHLEAAWSSS